MFQYKSATLGVLSAFSLLLSICLLNIDNYFGYHAPSAMSSDFERLYMLNDEQFGSLFTIYSLPNIILVFFSGVFIDKYGVRVSSLVFNLCIVIGLFICAMTPYPSVTFPSHLSYTSLLIGRLLLGIGGESVVACASTMISKWFTKDGYLNTAMSINQAIVQLLGSAASFFILPRLSSLFMAQLFTAGVAVFSLLSNIVYVYLEIHHDDNNISSSCNHSNSCSCNSISSSSGNSIENMKNKNTNTQYHAIIPWNESLNDEERLESAGSTSKSNIQMNNINSNHNIDDNHHDDTKNHANNAIIVSSSSSSAIKSYQNQTVYNNNDNNNSISSSSSSSSSNINHNTNNDDNNHNSCSNSNSNNSSSNNRSKSIFFVLTDLPFMFWLLMLHCGCLSPILYTFTAFGSLYLLDTFPSLTTLQQASDVISLLYVGIVFSPITGFLIDRCGHRILIQLITTINILLIFLLLILIPSINPYICLSYLGILFSITESNYLAMIGYIIPEEQLGTAYGISGCVISIALLVEPATVGYLRESTGSFTSSIWLYIVLIMMSVISCVWMLIIQKKESQIKSHDDDDDDEITF